jgi:hypothetical protein
MLTPYLGFEARHIAGVYISTVAAASGLAMAIDPSYTAPLTPTPYGRQMGRLTVASCTNSNNLHETGWLLQPVTATGPSVFSVLASIYDESVAVNQVCAIVLSASNCQVATDQYVASGTGAILFDGSVALDSDVAIHNGQPRVPQSGDLPRLQFKGQVVQRNTPLGIFSIK